MLLLAGAVVVPSAALGCGTEPGLTNRTVVLDYLRRLDDGGDIAALFDNDIVVDVPKHAIAYGKDAALDLFETFGTLTETSRHDYQTLNYVCQGNTVVVEGVSTGTTSNGRAFSPFDPATGGRFADVMEFRNGRIVRLSMYLDPDYGGATAERYPWLETVPDPDISPNAAYWTPFQTGYVTTDLDRAIALFSAQQGIAFTAPRELSLAVEDGSAARMRVAFAFAGTTQVEIIEPLDGSVAIYTEHLPPDGFALRLHHLGYLVRDAGAFDRMRAVYGDRDIPLPLASAEDADRTFFYADTFDTLGHYQEYFVVGPDPVMPDVPRTDAAAARRP